MAYVIRSHLRTSKRKRDVSALIAATDLGLIACFHLLMYASGWITIAAVTPSGRFHDAGTKLPFAGSTATGFVATGIGCVVSGGFELGFNTTTVPTTNNNTAPPIAANVGSWLFGFSFRTGTALAFNGRFRRVSLESSVSEFVAASATVAGMVPELWSVCRGFGMRTAFADGKWPSECSGTATTRIGFRRAQILELGRACIHQHHRNFAVLNLLWKGILGYAGDHGAHFLVGCSSLTSQVEAVGAAAYLQLGRHVAPAQWQTLPRKDFACAVTTPAREAVHIPRLMSAYLSLGAAICGPPAIDREFRTIDFLTWIDVKAPRLLALQGRGRFIG